MIGLVLIRKFKSRIKTVCTLRACVVDLTVYGFTVKVGRDIPVVGIPSGNYR